MSSKKSTRSTAPVSRPTKESPPESVPAPRVAAAAPAARAKAAPAPAPVAPDSAAQAEPAKPASETHAPAGKAASAKVATKPKARPAAGRAATPKTSDLAPLTPRAARARTTEEDLPVVVAPSPDAIAERPAPPAAMVVTDEDIRVRAYFLSLEHRARGGSDVDFWLVAERELRSHIKPGE